MLSTKEKARRYDILEQALHQKIDDLIETLCFDNACDESDIARGDLESLIQTDIKDIADSLFGDDMMAYYLIDFITCHYTNLTCHSLNPFKKCKV